MVHASRNINAEATTEIRAESPAFREGDTDHDKRFEQCHSEGCYLRFISKVFERGTPVTISVSRDVAARAATSGLSVNVGAIIRVPVLENADKVDNIFRDM